MSENKSEDLAVPIPGSGELIDVETIREAIKTMPDQDLATWYIKYYKLVMGAFGMARGELIGRMVKQGAEVLHSPNGQRVELQSPPKRECDKEVLRAVEKMIQEKFNQTIPLIRIKEKVEPDMNGIKLARKLGMDVATAIAEGLREIPGTPSIKIEGVDKDRAAEAFGDPTE